MAPSRVKFFLFGAIACLYASVCLSEHLQKEETVFSVGHSSDKNPHSGASFFFPVRNLKWISTGKHYGDPVIHIFGKGEENEIIDLLLPSQELNGEHVFSFWAAKPHLKQYTPAQSPSIYPSLASPSPVPYSPPSVVPTPSPPAQAPSPLSPSASVSPVSPSIPPPYSYSPSPTSFPPSAAPSSYPHPFPPSPTTPSPYLSPPIFPPSVSPPFNPPSVSPPINPPFPSVSPPTFPPSVSPPILPPSSSPSPSLPPPIFPPQLPPQSPSTSSSPTPSPIPTSLSPSPTPSVTPSQPFPLPTPTPSPSPSPTPSSPLPTPIPSPVPTPLKISILSNLIVPNGAPLEPDFDSFVFNYKVSFGSNVRRFFIVAYLPQDDEDYKNLLFIESVPLKSGEKSPPLKLGKKGETLAFHIYVRAVNHAPTTYVLSVTREAGHSGFGTITIIFVVLACIVGALILMVLGNAAYLYARTGRMLQLGDFQIFRGRVSTLYAPLIASGVINDDSRI